MKATLHPVQKNRLHEEIITQIQKKILSGELRDGEKLPPERILAESFNVNRATVREALKKLEMLGLVVILHGDGIYVKDYLKSGNLDLLKNLAYGDFGVNSEVLSDLLEVRNIIVPEMAYFAALRRNDSDLAAIESILADSSLTVQEKDIAIHGSIARAGKNLLYIIMHNFFVQIFMDFGFLYFKDGENRKRSLKFHEDVYRAIREKRGDDARRITGSILSFARKKSIEYINKSEQ